MGLGKVGSRGELRGSASFEMLTRAPHATPRLPPHAGSERRRPNCAPGVNPCRRPPPHRTRRTHAAAAAAATNPQPQPPSALRPPPSASAFPALSHPDVAHFLNLTNGLEAAPLLRSLALPYTLVRLPSTLCEQQRFDALVAGADASLLAAAALGRTCLVWDFGSRGLASRGSPPRAVWYGLEFLAYAAHRKWFPTGLGNEGGEQQQQQQPRRAVLRGHDVTPAFEAALRGGRGWSSAGVESPAAAAGGGGDPRFSIPGFDPAVSGVSKAALKRVRYFRRFVPGDARPASHIRLWGAHRPTARDSDTAWHVTLAREECGPAGGVGGGGGGMAGAAAVSPSSAATTHAAATAADGRVCPAVLAAELEALGFGLFMGGVPHAPSGVPPAADAARARGGGG